jgi:hypothetical protein
VQKQLFNYTDRNHSGHIAAGLMGIPIVTRWAIENKAANFMYSMLKKRDYPGYLYMIDNGATTTWESWDRDRSRIHNCYNGIGSWFYQAVGGIRPDEANPGYRHVFIDPQIPQGVTWAKTIKESPYGTIQVDWALESTGQLKINITLPVGTQGTFVIPEKAQSCTVDGEESTDLQNVVLENGEHEIVVRLEGGLAINRLPSSALNVYPNPFHETLYIAPAGLNIKKVCIYDVAGKKIKEMRNVQNSIDLRSIHKGAYFASLETGEWNRLVCKRFKILKL